MEEGSGRLPIPFLIQMYVMSRVGVRPHDVKSGPVNIPFAV